MDRSRACNLYVHCKVTGYGRPGAAFSGQHTKLGSQTGRDTVQWVAAETLQAPVARAHRRHLSAGSDSASRLAAIDPGARCRSPVPAVPWILIAPKATGTVPFGRS